MEGDLGISNEGPSASIESQSQPTLRGIESTRFRCYKMLCRRRHNVQSRARRGQATGETHALVLLRYDRPASVFRSDLIRERHMAAAKPRMRDRIIKGDSHLRRTSILEPDANTGRSRGGGGGLRHSKPRARQRARSAWTHHHGQSSRPLREDPAGGACHGAGNTETSCHARTGRRTRWGYSGRDKEPGIT